MHWDTLVIDTSTIDSIVALDTISKYVSDDILIMYIDAKTGFVYPIDSNKYGSGWWVTCGVDTTTHLGFQNSQMRTCSTCPYQAADSRNLSVRSYYGTSSYNQGGITWSAVGLTNGLSGYFCLQKAWDYFDTYHGFYDGPIHGHRYNQILGANYTGGSTYFRTSYTIDNPTSTGISGVFVIAHDGNGTTASFAEMDIMAHEYTHSILAFSGPRLNRFGEAGAIQEGLCDIFGTYAASHAFPSRYFSNWTNGFGWQISGFKRSFSNPSADLDYNGVSTPGSAHYGDSPFTTSYGTEKDNYIRSGLMRKWFHLLAFGGTHYGIGVSQINSSSNLETDVFDGIGWMWSNLSYYDARNQYLALYEFRYGKCSPQWRAVAKAWAAVGVGTVPSCLPIYMTGSGVIGSSELNTNASKFTVGSSLPIPPTPGIKSISSYSWIVPLSWVVSYNPSHSEMTLENTTDYSSQMVSCVVSYSDLSKDTVTTFLHIIDELSPRGIDSPTISTTSDAVSFYPNPVKNNLNISLPEMPKAPLSFKVLDLTGREVYNGTIYSKNALFYIPNIAPGLYMAKITGDGKDYIKRLVVQ